MSLEFQDWGEIEYGEAVERQLSLLEKVASGESPDQIVFCSHPAVVTLGKAAKPEDLMGWQGAVSPTSRGGRATYHGPEQLVIYPIVNLNRAHKGFKTRDIHAYLRALETSMIEGLEGLDVRAQHRPLQQQISEKQSDKDDLLYTGVWVGEQKLASIGIAVKKWVTYHGAAINLWTSAEAFSGISPCGFQQNTMTDLQSLTGKRLDQSDVIEALRPVFTHYFEVTGQP